MYTERVLPVRQVEIQQVMQPCPLRLLKVRVVECHLHRGVAGLRVTVARDGRDPIAGDTDASGYVIFRFSAVNLAQAVALRVSVAMPVGGQYEPKAGGAAREVTMTDEGGGKELTLTLRSHWVTPPGDLDARVRRALKGADIRIWVDDGANYGNQASTVDCIKEIKRLDAGANFAEDGEHPIVRVLAKPGEFQDYEYKVRAAVIAPTAEKLEALWRRFFTLALPGVEESEDDSQTSYTVADGGAEATVTLHRMCGRVQLADGSFDEETSQAHFADAARSLWDTDEARALTLTRLDVAQSGEDPTIVATPFPVVTLALWEKLGDAAAEQQVSHALTLHVAALPEVNAQRLRAWLLHVMHILYDDLAEQQDPDVAGFTVREDGTAARITITAARGGSADGDFDEAVSQAHLNSAVRTSLGHDTATALGIARVVLRTNDEGDDAVIAPVLTANRALTFKVFSYELPSPGARLATLAPQLSDLYARATWVAAKADFDVGARENIIALVPAVDIGDPSMQITQEQLRGFAGKVGAVDAVVLQPFLWNVGKHVIVEDQTIHVLCMPEQAAWRYGVPALLSDDATAALAPQALQAVFTALLAAKQEGTVRLQVGYGLHQAAAPQQTGKNLAAALCGLGDPKVVLVVPCKVPGFRAGFAEVQGASVLLLDGAVNPDQTLQAAIGSAQVTAILVTLSGALPGPLFTQLVMRSQLPVLFEGANTAGQCLNARLPHLSVKLGSTTYATKPGQEASVTRLGQLTDLLNKANPSAQEVTRLGAFLGAAAAGDSEVGAYFTEVSDHVCHPRLDQLELALYRLDLQRRLASGAEQLVPPVEPAALDADALAV